MAGFLKNFSKSSSEPSVPTPAARRISTPAGQRLSTIMENGAAGGAKANGRKTKYPGLDELPYEEDRSGHTETSVWSEGEKLKGLRANPHYTKRGGWKRLVLIAVAILLAIIIAVTVGITVSKKKSSDAAKNMSSSDSSKAQATGTSNPNSPSTTSPSSPSSPMSTSTSLPSNFPIGTYSILTFLDTVQTNCTSNAKTWSCYPYTTYYSDKTSSLATFNWVISKNSDKFQISSTTNPFSISFTDSSLSLEDSGKDTERYTFRLRSPKMVQPTGSITDDNSATTCYFNETTLQASLYTKQAPSDEIQQQAKNNKAISYPVWPGRVRIEQVASGGEDAPQCYKMKDGQRGDEVHMDSQSGGNLCSCLYKNWNTPSQGFS